MLEEENRRVPNVTFHCLSILFVNKHGLTSVNIWYKPGCSRYNGQIFNNKKDWERFWPQWTSRESWQTPNSSGKRHI